MSSVWPIVGDSKDIWGTQLLTGLAVAHNDDGTLKVGGGPGTAKAVLFVGASGQVAQDASHFSYDATAHSLTLAGDILLGGSVVSSGGSGAFPTGLVAPSLYGGTAAGSALTFYSTSGAGSTDFIDIRSGNGGSILNARADHIGLKIGHTVSDTTQPGFVLYTQAQTPGRGQMDVFKTVSGAVTAMAFWHNTGTPTNVGNIGYSDTATTYGTSSDRRIKTNIVDTALSAAEAFGRLPVRDFNYLVDPDGERNTGFIAQELYEVFPHAVIIPPENVGDDGTGPLQEGWKPWSIDYGRVTPLLAEAVRELAARNAGALDELSKRVSALEAAR